MRWRFILVLAVCLVFGFGNAEGRADLIFNISDNGFGNVSLQITASGQVLGGGVLIGYGTAGDTFLSDGTPLDFDNDGNVFKVADKTATTFSSDDRGDDGIGLNSAIQIQTFAIGGGFTPLDVGDDLSSLTGSYDLEDMEFSQFIPNLMRLSRRRGQTSLMSGTSR